MVRVCQVDAPEQKADICNAILRALPSWFGIEASIVEYVDDVRAVPFWVAMDGDEPVGFVALKLHNPYTAEVMVMGVLPAHHRHGLGHRLVERCESFCAANRFEYLTVKTVDESDECAGYAKTRAFYLAMGFRPLEVFPLLWDEDNPCLFLAKYLASAKEELI